MKNEEGCVQCLLGKLNLNTQKIDPVLFLSKIKIYIVFMYRENESAPFLHQRFKFLALYHTAAVLLFVCATTWAGPCCIGTAVAIIGAEAPIGGVGT